MSPFRMSWIHKFAITIIFLSSHTLTQQCQMIQQIGLIVCMYAWVSLISVLLPLCIFVRNKSSQHLDLLVWMLIYVAISNCILQYVQNLNYLYTFSMLYSYSCLYCAHILGSHKTTSSFVKILNFVLFVASVALPCFLGIFAMHGSLIIDFCCLISIFISDLVASCTSFIAFALGIIGNEYEKIW